MTSPRATPRPWAKPPTICPSTTTGWSWRPQSWTITYLRIDLDGRRVDAARPRHGRRGPELRRPESGRPLLDQAFVAERGASEVAERDRAGRGADHERAAVLEAHVLQRALEQPRGHATGLLLHGDRGDHHRVAGVDRDPASAGAVAVREQRGVAAAHAHVVEAGAEVLGAHLGEHGLVALARVRDADEHLDVALLVDLHRRPLARTHAAARLQRAHHAQPDPAPLHAPLRLLLAPPRVVERGQRARKLLGVITP